MTFGSWVLLSSPQLKPSSKKYYRQLQLHSSCHEVVFNTFAPVSYISNIGSSLWHFSEIPRLPLAVIPGHEQRVAPSGSGQNISFGWGAQARVGHWRPKAAAAADSKSV